MAEKNNLSVDGSPPRSAKAGVNIKTLKDRIRAQIVWQERCGRKFRRDVQIGDADVDKAMSEAGEEGGGGTAETTLQLRQVKFEIPAAPIRAPSPPGLRQPKLCAPDLNPAPSSPRA